MITVQYATFDQEHGVVIKQQHCVDERTAKPSDLFDAISSCSSRRVAMWTLDGMPMDDKDQNIPFAKFGYKDGSRCFLLPVFQCGGRA